MRSPFCAWEMLPVENPPPSPVWICSWEVDRRYTRWKQFGDLWHDTHSLENPSASRQIHHSLVGEIERLLLIGGFIFFLCSYESGRRLRPRPSQKLWGFCDWHTIQRASMSCEPWSSSDLRSHHHVETTLEDISSILTFCQLPQRSYINHSQR